VGVLKQRKAWNRARQQADQSRARQQADLQLKGPLVYTLASMLLGAACRGDETDTHPDEGIEQDDSDDSPIAGAIQGSFAVSSTGEGTYVLPLILPPGAAGMQPSPAVAYNSASGDGMLGMGFSLYGQPFKGCSRAPIVSE
jgi:Salmonella virulence plasmid 65kDa B protein